jgi:trehalose 6-phosphate phosphatase
VASPGGPGKAPLETPLERTALCLDYDGTLAPIVPDPEAARPFENGLDLLGRLAARAAAVALVSGRPAEFLATHAAVSGVRYLGLYGLEEIRDGQLLVDPAVAGAEPAVRKALAELAVDRAVRESGAHVEDKGRAVAVHLRRVADPERWAEPVAEAAGRIAAANGLDVQRGRLVWELRPAVRSDKGDAVRKVVASSGAAAVLVAGDDLGDLPAFAAAADLAAGAGIEAVRVAVASAESPSELLARADVTVEGPEGLRALLEDLLR